LIGYGPVWLRSFSGFVTGLPNTRKKPDLKGLRKWGEKVYVRIEGGTKLGGRVHEGKWLGVDEESKGIRVYWPDMKNVTVE